MKRILKILAWVIILFVGLILLAGLITQTSLFKSYVKDFAIKELNGLLEGHLSIGEIKGNLFSKLEIHDLVLTLEMDTLLILPELDLSYNLLALLNDQIHVHELNIIEPSINLMEGSDGTWDFDRLIAARVESDTIASSIGEPFGFIIILDSFSLLNGTAKIKTDETIIPKKTTDLNIVFTGTYSTDEMWIRLDSLSFRTNQPDFALKRLSFEFLKDDKYTHLKDLSIVTKSNVIQSNIQHHQTENSQLNLNSKKLALDEWQFILPEIQLKNNPDVELISQFTNDSLDFELTLQSEEERLTILGSFNNYQTFFDQTRGERINIDLELKSNNINLQNWSDNLPETFLNGNVRVNGSFTGINDLNASLLGRFNKTQLSDYSAETLDIKVDYHSGDASGIIQICSDIADIDLEINFRNLIDTPLYDGTVSIHHLNLGNLLLSDGVSSDLNFKLYYEGKNFKLPTNQLSIISEWGPSHINEITIDSLMTKLYLIGTQYKIDTLHFQTAVGILSGTGDGDIVANHRINYSYTPGDLTLIAKISGADSINAQGILSGTVYGNPDSLINDVKFNLYNVTFNEFSIDSLTGKSQSILVDSDPTIGIEMIAKDIMTGKVAFDKFELSSIYDDDLISSDIKIQFDQKLRSSLKAVLHLDSILTLSIPKIDFEFLTDYWSGRINEIVYNPGRDDLFISGLNIECMNSEDKRRFFAEGKISLSGNEDFQLGIEGLHLDNILSYAGIQSQIKGRMNFGIDLSGTADKPIFNGNMQFEEGAVGAVGYKGINSWFDYANDQFNFDFSLNFNGEDSLTARGHLPLHLSLSDTLDIIDYQKSIGLNIKSETIPVSLFLQDLKAFPDASGTLVCDFRFSNTLANPSIKGFFQLKDGMLKSPYWGIDYQDIDMKISARDDKFLLENFQINSGKGNIKASGEVQLEFSEKEDKVVYSNMNVSASNFFLMKHRDFEMLISADIEYQMENEKPTIGGYVDINRSSFYLPAVMDRAGYMTTSAEEIKPALIKAREKKLGLEEPQTTQTLVQDKRDTLEIPGFLDLLEGELELRINRNTWIRNQQLRAELGGKIKLIIDKGDFSLKGPVDIVRGQYDLFGRRFIVNQGKIDFLGGENINPPLFLEAEYVYRTVGREKRSLVVQVSGNMEYPIITFLENNNQISQEDAISIVLYGRKRDELSFGTQSDMANMDGNTAAMGIVSNIVSDRLSRSVGDDLKLDVVEVNASDNWQSANFVVGKYITENIFVTYKREFGQNMDNNLNPETISMEYEIRRNFFFQMIQGNPQDTGYDLLLRFNWD